MDGSMMIRRRIVFYGVVQGVGVLYSGFFRACAGISEALQKLLELPEGHRVVTCMVIGYPAVRYQRIVPRKDLKAKTL